MIGIIIQARMGSTRLPGKVLMDIGGKTLLQHIFIRLEQMRQKTVIVVATSNHQRDNIIEQYCKENHVLCFRGSEDNVLSRYYECAKKMAFGHIVRLTADNPFVDAEEIDRLIEFHCQENNDFSESFSQLPIGVGAEIFSYRALERDMENAYLPHHFEHVDEYILENKNDFKFATLSVTRSKNYPNVRLTVDTQEDYEKACYIVQHSTNAIVRTEEAIALESQYA